MRLILVPVCIASGLAFLVPLTAQNPTPVATTSPKKRAPAAKVGLEELKLHVKKEAEGLLAPGDAANLIKTRGVIAVTCTAELRDELRKMGATDSVLGLIECPYPWSAPQTPPAPSPAAAGPVAVNCVPEDCEIAVLAMPLLRAEKGVKTITGLPPGKTTLEFRQEGFQSSSQILTLKEQQSSSVSAALKPLESTQRKWAAAALIKAVSSTGGFMESALVRAIVMNHWIHHRGQLSVYLRLLDVPVPSIYGPSADENPFAART